MSAAAEPEAARATVDAPEESGDLDPAKPGGAPSTSIGNEQPLAQAPVSLATAGPTRAGQALDRADGPPLEIAPADWPALTLQMLFYSPEGGRSFVQINGRNYRVGERLEDGPEVLDITPHGVILAYEGKKVLLAMDR